MSVRRREYKLYYFHFRGRAEVARLILAYAKVPYEDIRYEREEEWPKHKPRMPFGQLPCLEWKGQMLPQSTAIFRFLAHRHGLGGSDEWQSAQIDALCALVSEAVDELRPVYMATMAGNEDSKKEAIDQYVTKTLEPLLRRLEQRLTDNGTGFLIGNKVSLADLTAFNFYDTVQGLGMADALAKSSQVTNLFNRIGDIPTIKEWINKRPVTPF